MTKNYTKEDFTIPSSPWLWLMNVGLLLIVAGTVLPLLRIEGSLFRWLYSAGAVIALVGRVLAPSYKGSVLRVRRLARIELWSCVIFCAGAFFMWYTPERLDWLAFTLAGGVLQVYSSLMSAHTLNKELRAREKSQK